MQSHSTWNTPERWENPAPMGLSEAMTIAYLHWALPAYQAPTVLETYFLLSFNRAWPIGATITDPILQMGTLRPSEGEELAQGLGRPGVGEGASTRKHWLSLPASRFGAVGRRWDEAPCAHACCLSLKASVTKLCLTPAAWPFPSVTNFSFLSSHVQNTFSHGKLPPLQSGVLFTSQPGMSWLIWTSVGHSPPGPSHQGHCAGLFGPHEVASLSPS